MSILKPALQMGIVCCVVAVGCGDELARTVETRCHPNLIPDEQVIAQNKSADNSA